MIADVELGTMLRRLRVRIPGFKAPPRSSTPSSESKRRSWLVRGSIIHGGATLVPPEDLIEDISQDFKQLPFDVLLRILLLLDVRDMLAMSQTSRQFHNVCTSHFIWKQYAANIILRSRPLVLRNTTALDDMTFHELKLSVVRTAMLEDNWNSEKATRRGSSKKVALKFPVTSPRSLFYTVFVRNYLLSPTGDKHLTVWDLDQGKSVGKYDMRRTFAASGLILAVREHYPSHSLFYIVTGDLISSDYGHTMQFYILRITFPNKETGGPNTSFAQVAEFSFSMMQTVAMYILDAVRRIICVVCRYPETDLLAIYVLLDWNTGESNLINTGLTYEYRKSVLGVRLSEDGEYIIIRTERDGEEIQQCHSLTFLRDDSSESCWKSKLFHPKTPPIAHDDSERKFFWEEEKDKHSPFYQPISTTPGGNAGPNTSTVVFRCWNMSPWWPDYGNSPRPTSCVVLYRTAMDGEGQSAGFEWRISQYFSSGAVDSTNCADGFALPVGPMACRRFVVTLRDPVLVSVLDDEMPVLGFSYNQAAWIEQVEDEVPPSRSLARRMSLPILGRRHAKKRLVARIASFPDPGECPGKVGCEMAAAIKTLDVPARVLSTARDISIDAELGTVAIITKSNVVHVFTYC